MLKIGLTGGIGSGKSTVARIFESLGIPVFYADAEAKKIMESDPDVRQQLIETFGDTAFIDHRLNREYLSSLVFKQPDMLDRLNAIVHPATIRNAKDWFSRQRAPYAIKEAAVLFESGSAYNLDYIIGVAAPAALRTYRVMQREGVSREAVSARMDRQISDSVKMKLCDFVVTNDEQQPLLPQLLALHEKFLSLATTTE